MIRAATGSAAARGAPADIQKPGLVSELWSALSELAASLSVCASDDALEAAQGSRPSLKCPALPEDWLLRAFVPLQASQASIDFVHNAQVRNWVIGQRQGHISHRSCLA